MSLVPTLHVEHREGKIRYRIMAPGRDGGGALEEEFSGLLDDDARLALQQSAEELLRSAESAAFSKDAKKRGAVLYRTLVPPRLRGRLKALSGPLLITTSLYGLPWEILYDGEEFWGLRYALGKRIIVNRDVPSSESVPQPGGRLRALIIGADPYRADPYRKLPFVDQEVESLCDTLEEFAETYVVSGDTATFDNVTALLSDGFDLIHYSGHVVAGSQGQPALLLADERRLSAAVIEPNLAGSPLVFLNGCASVRGAQGAATDRWEETFSSVAYGFLFGGAMGVVGTLCDVSDSQAARLAAEFYRQVLTPVSVGEALRAARAHCRTVNPHAPAWLSFVFYGNPLQELVREKPAAKPKPEPARRLFAPDGSLVAGAWQDEAVQLLRRARAEALGRSAEAVGPFDLMLALVATPLFRSALASWDAQAAAAPPLLVQLLRARTKSGGQAPLSSSPSRRYHFDPDTLAIIAAVGAAAGTRALEVRDLLLGILSGTARAIDSLLAEVGLDPVRLRQAVEATEQPPLAAPPAAPPSAPPAVPRTSAPHSGAQPPRASTASQVGTPELFDALGQLRNAAVSPPVFEVLMRAAGEATAVGDAVIEPLHIFIALVCSPHAQRALGIPTKDQAVLSRFARSAIYACFCKQPGPPLRATLPERRLFSSEALEVLHCAARASAEPLRWEGLLVEIDRVLGPTLKALMASREPEFNRLVDAFVRTLTSHEAHLPNGPRGAGASAQQGGASTGPHTVAKGHLAPPPASMPHLDQLGRDVTEEARAGRFAPLIGRREELAHIAQILARKDKPNVLLIGEAGVGKTAIVEGLARNIAEGSAPPHLRDRRIIEIDTGRLLAGTSLHGDLEARVQGLLAEVEDHPEVILFIDEFHAFVQAGGGGQRTALTVGNQLKAALARGQLAVIGATTEQEFSLSVERDPALMRRFRILRVPEPSPEETLEILRHLKTHLEEQYQVTVADDALIVAVKLAERHMPGHMPDKARDLVVDACAAHRVEEHADQRAMVSAEDIALLVSRCTKIPVGTLSTATCEAALALAAALAQRVVGQDDAVARVAARLRRARVVRDPRRPLAVLLFAGPTGVGKTALARAIAAEYCGDPAALTVIPMNEYGERLAVSRLIGVGPGWAGHEEEPVLVGALKKRAHRVILLDEIDKAHGDVWQMLMRLFDEGLLVDPRSNQEINGREAIYVMTSNFALAHASTIGFSVTPDGPAADPRALLLQSVPPEFVTRIDDIIVFVPLDGPAIKKIAAMQLAELVAWVQQEHKVDVQFDDAVTAWVAAQVSQTAFGARAVARCIDTQVREPLSEALLEQLRGVRTIRGTVVQDVLRFETGMCDTKATPETSQQ